MVYIINWLFYSWLVFCCSVDHFSFQLHWKYEYSRHIFLKKKKQPLVFTKALTDYSEFHLDHLFCSWLIGWSVLDGSSIIFYSFSPSWCMKTHIFWLFSRWWWKFVLYQEQHNDSVWMPWACCIITAPSSMISAWKATSKDTYIRYR